MPERVARNKSMLSPAGAILLWAGVCAAAFALEWHGGVRPGPTLLAATFGLFALLMAGELWLASPTLLETLTRAAGPQGGVLIALWPLAAYVAYALATGRFATRPLGIALVFTLVPVVLAALAHDRKPGSWHDYAAMLVIYGLYASLRPLFVAGATGDPLGGMLPMLFAVNVAAATFLFVRRLEGVGYSIGWPAAWIAIIMVGFGAASALDIPLGMAIHFIQYDPGAAVWREVPANLLRLFLLTAWPEEFLFRGLLQNFLGKNLRSETAGWILASVIFGLSHIFHGFPNWRYVLLATLAGLVYGLLWRKTKSMFPGAVVHALLDTTWQTLFRTL